MLMNGSCCPLHPFGCGQLQRLALLAVFCNWLGGDGQLFHEALSERRLIATIAASFAAFVCTIVMYIWAKKNKAAATFVPPPIETFAELQSASRRAVQGQMLQESIQRQVQAESVEQTMRAVGLRTNETAVQVGFQASRAASALGQLGVNLPVPFIGPLIGIGVMIVGGVVARPA